MKFGKTQLSVVLATLLIASSIVGATGGMVNWGDSDAAPNLEIERTETKAVHNMTWGDTDDALRKYENDNANVVKMDARINDSARNPVEYVPTDIEESDFGQFPRAKSNVSALDASEWSVGGQNASKASVSDTETAPGVEAVRLDTDGTMADGDSVTFTFSNFSLDSDEAKRFLIVGQDLAELEAGATVEYRVVDEDGDYVASEVNTTRSSGEDFMANSTGEGFIYSRQTGKMNVTGGADSLNNIEKVEIVVSDGDADVAVPLLNLDKTSEYDFGTKSADTDDDDDYESVDHTEKKTAGALKVTGVDTLGATFNDARLHNVALDVVETPAHQPDDNIYLNLTQTDKYPGYHGTATVAVRMSLADAYDLSSSGAVLSDVQSVTSDRLISVEYAEGVSSDETVDKEVLDSTNFADVTAQYGSDGKEVQLDSSLSEGQPVLVKFKLKLDKTQFEAFKKSTGGGDTGAKSSGGTASIPIIGGLFVALMGLLRKLGGE